MSIRSSRFIMFRSSLSSKIFCLPVLSVLERRVLKYPNTVCLFSSVLSVFEVTNLEYKHVNLFCLHDESIPLKLWNDSLYFLNEFICLTYIRPLQLSYDYCLYVFKNLFAFNLFMCLYLKCVSCRYHTASLSSWTVSPF